MTIIVIVADDAIHITVFVFFYRFTKIGFEENVTRRRPITKNNVAPTYAKFAIIIIIQVQTNKLYLYETNF